MERGKWIGLADVRACPGSDVLGLQRAAFVTVIAYAQNIPEFRRVVAGALLEYGLELVGIEDVELLSTRVARHEVDATLLRDAERIPKGTKFVFGEFHTYPLAHSS